MDYTQLLSGAGTTTLENKRLQNMVLNIFKCLHLNGYPAYMKQMFPLRSVSYSPRGSNILSLPKPTTTSYGLNSFCYLASKLWDSLPENYRTGVHTKTLSSCVMQSVLVIKALVFL